MTVDFSWSQFLWIVFIFVGVPTIFCALLLWGMSSQREQGTGTGCLGLWATGTLAFVFGFASCAGQPERRVPRTRAARAESVPDVAGGRVWCDGGAAVLPRRLFVALGQDRRVRGSIGHYGRVLDGVLCRGEYGRHRPVRGRRVAVCDRMGVQPERADADPRNGDEAWVEVARRQAVRVGQPRHTDLYSYSST